MVDWLFHFGLDRLNLLRTLDSIIRPLIDDGFLEQELRPKRCYFLNTQKLSRTSRLLSPSDNRNRPLICDFKM